MLKYPKTYLGIYASVLTAAFAALVLMGAKSPGSATFDTINVHRINVREPDGTLRMVISDKAELPGLIIHGKEYPHERPRAGMLFYNDEGTEQGGLVFSGKKGTDGKVSSGLSLTFDRFDRDQQLQLIGIDQDGRTVAGMQVNDVTGHSTLRDMQESKKLDANMSNDARKALLAELTRDGYANNITGRYFAGKSASDSSVVMLSDANGKPRLMLMVTKSGAASIQFLNADGKVQRTLAANSPADK